MAVILPDRLMYFLYPSSYDCVPLPRPVDSEDDLQQVESMEFAKLKGAFLEEYYMLEVNAPAPI